MRMLLKSCASPPVSWPTASIFCASRSGLVEWKANALLIGQPASSNSYASF